MIENWISEDVGIPNEQYDVICILQDSEGTKIELIGDYNEVEILFYSADSIRITDEGRRLETYFTVPILSEYRNNFVGNPFFKILNSTYIEWIKKESLGFSGEIFHYAIVTRNEIIDVISSFPPRVVVRKK